MCIEWYVMKSEGVFNNYRHLRTMCSLWICVGLEIRSVWSFGNCGVVSFSCYLPRSSIDQVKVFLGSAAQSETVSHKDTIAWFMEQCWFYGGCVDLLIVVNLIWRFIKVCAPDLFCPWWRWIDGVMQNPGFWRKSTRLLHNTHYMKVNT